MKDSIVKKLNRKPHPGVSTFMFRDQRKGEKDYRNSQLCIKDEKYSTPWIIERMRGLSEYDHKIYGRVDKALEPIAHMIASECQELEVIKPPKMPENLDKENRERLSASFGYREAEVEKRKTDIRIHLSEMQIDMETMDAALQHHLQRAESIVMKHVSAYWSGILKAASDSSMPPVPYVEMMEIPGKAVYEMHMNRIREYLNQVMSEEHREVK